MHTGTFDPLFFGGPLFSFPEWGLCQMFSDFDPAFSYIGERESWGADYLIGISPEARLQHMAIFGQTGTGKSTLIRNLIIQDIERGHGVGLIDPHGDLADEILDCIPPERTDHVVYVNPADHEYPVGLNVLRASTGAAPHLVSSYIVGALKSIWRDSWGPRMEYILYACLAALQDCDNVTLLAVQRMLVDSGYRDWVIRQVKDPMVKAYWQAEFANYDKRFLAEIISPIQNKIGQLVMSPPIRHMLGQVRSTVDIRFVMDNSRLLIANLSKGRIGEDKANLIGSLLVTQFQLAALSRADVRPSKRIPFHLYVDEYHNFATDSFASILSEARKYGLALTLAAQYTAQTRPEITSAVFGNVGTLVCFRVGEPDAAMIARHFGDGLPPGALTGLGNYRTWVKAITPTGFSETFRATTLRPIDIADRGGRRDVVIAHSRERYSIRREIVESRIRRWMGEAQVIQKPTFRKRPDSKRKRQRN